MGLPRESADGPISPEGKSESLHVCLEKEVFHFNTTLTVVTVVADIFKP